MLNAIATRRRPCELQRLAAAPANTNGHDIDWRTPIDRSRWFFCETLTPLYYTSVYRELALEHRRRYNQLTGMLANEVIGLLETEFLNASLRAVESRGDRSADLRTAVLRFKDDERRHADVWRRLNLLSEPVWYARTDRHLVRFPRAAAAIARFLAQHPVAFPVVFWVQLVQEERSIDISRRCIRVPSGVIEPRYLAAYEAHIQDEVRHVQIDWHLIERFYGNRSRAVRKMTAWLFKAIVQRLLLTPVHSMARVIDVLVSEHPELTPLVPCIKRELRELETSDAYHEMMYSRHTTPITFTLFDRFEEFQPMQHVLRAYTPERVESYS